jgi:hypothetical protein
MDFKAGFDVSASLGEANSKLDKVVESLAGISQVLRTHPARDQAALYAVAAFTGTPSNFTQIGDVPGGMGWQVERISFGLTAGVAVTTPGTLIVYIGTVEVARTTVVPNTLFFRGYQCYVIPGEDLNAVWVGGVTTPAGAPLMVDVAAAEFPLLAPVRPTT